MKKLTAITVSLLLSGCTINAIAPVQVDQRSGEFPTGSGQQQTVNVGGSLAGPAGAPVSGGTSGSAEVKVSGVSFAAVRKFSNKAIVQALSFEQVIVADGNTVYVTTDAGQSWREFKGVGALPITSMHWRSMSEGVVGAEAGNLHKVSLGESIFTQEVLDTGLPNELRALYWGPKLLFAIMGSGEVITSSDNGSTWSQPINIHAAPGARLYPINQDQVVIQCPRIGTYAYSNGAFTKLSDDDLVTVGGGVIYSATKEDVNFQSSDGVWRVRVGTSSDAARAIGPSIKTTNQIIRNGRLANIEAASDKVLVGLMFGYGGPAGHFGSTVSVDGGLTWTQPKPLDIAYLEWYRPFSETKAWGLQAGTLYRSGM